MAAATRGALGVVIQRAAYRKLVADWVIQAAAQLILVADSRHLVVDCLNPGCGVAAPTCGLAGTLLGGGGSCGLPEPSCGSTGLGYSGGFGLCGGSGCDSCGSGGFLGRQLHQVNPCACGGSLIADMARGFLSLVDRTVGAVVGGIFGGLQAVTCHASGTFAALQCAAQASCDSCGGPGCDGGCAGPGYGVPSCGAPACGAPAAPSCGCPTCGVASSAPAQSYPVSNSYPIADSYAAPASNDIYLPPAAPVAPAMNGTAVETSPIPATPMESVPTQSIPTDPFIDDPISAPAPIPQASRTRSVPVGFRVFGKQAPQQVRTATYQQQQRLQQARPGVQQTGHNARAMAANVKPSKPHRYQQAKHRGVNLRR